MLGAPHSDADNEVKRRKAIEAVLDQGYGSCLLNIPNIAEKVVEAWKHFDGKKYDLISYVVMPNHVHLIIKTFEGYELGKLVWSWKRHVSKFVFENRDYTENFMKRLSKVNQSLLDNRTPENIQRFLKPASECGAPGMGKRSLWQREYWDRFIRDEQHLKSAVEYILQNPVKAGLIRNFRG